MTVFYLYLEVFVHLFALAFKSYKVFFFIFFSVLTNPTFALLVGVESMKAKNFFVLGPSEKFFKRVSLFAAAIPAFFILKYEVGKMAVFDNKLNSLEESFDNLKGCKKRKTLT